MDWTALGSFPSSFAGGAVVGGALSGAVALYFQGRYWVAQEKWKLKSKRLPIIQARLRSARVPRPESPRCSYQQRVSAACSGIDLLPDALSQPRSLSRCGKALRTSCK